MPFHSTGTRESCTERCCRCSISSWSETVPPSSTRPARFTAPAVSARASTSVVLPDPEWPTSTTFRTDVGRSAACALPAAPGCVCALSPMILPPVHGEVTVGADPWKPSPDPVRGHRLRCGSGGARGPSSFPLPSRRVHTKDVIPAAAPFPATLGGARCAAVRVHRSHARAR